MKSYVKQLQDKIEEMDLINFNITCYSNFGLGDSGTDEEIARDVLLMIESYENGNSTDITNEVF